MSLTLSTQVVLLLQQVVLLPLQIRYWDQATTASWYAAISLAALTGVADLGLRTAGHADLISLVRWPNEPESAERFRRIWSAMRVLVIGVTVVIAGVTSFLEPTFSAGIDWKVVLIVAGGLEAIVSIRIMYLDTLGHYNRAETVYLMFAAGRLIVSIAAITLFTAGVEALSWIYCVSAAAALAYQEILCRPFPMLDLLGSFGRFNLASVLAQVSRTVAGPSALWAQLHLPVLVLSTIAPPVVVTVYVTLRAIFGMARQTIQQFSRATSVEYVRLSSEGRWREAHALLSALSIAVSSLAALLACVVLFQKGIIIRFIGIDGSRGFYGVCALAFGVAGSFLSYNAIAAVMVRRGQLTRIASRQYLYLTLAAIAALLGLLLRSPGLYVVLAATAETFGAVAFMIAGQSAAEAAERNLGRPSMAGGLLCSLSVLCAWYLQSDVTGFKLAILRLSDLSGTLGFLVIDVIILLVLQVLLNKDLLSVLRSRTQTRSA